MPVDSYDARAEALMSTKSWGSQAAAPDTGVVELVSGAALEPEPVSWLWPGWLARGKLHILAGAPGCGKTTIALALATTLTVGGRWPDRSPSTVANVLIWSGEDDPADTLLPRLLAMGGDRNQVHFVRGVTDSAGQRSFDPSRDMNALLSAAQRVGNIGLLIVDPIVNAVAGDSHKNGETRRALQPIVDVGARLNAAVLGISHYSKGTQGRDPVERVTGSLAFGALPRLIFGAAQSTDAQGRRQRIFVRAKSNIGPNGDGFAYEIRQEALTGYPGVQTSSLLWGAELQGDAHTLLSAAEGAVDSERPSALTEAEDFLRIELAEHSVPSKELRKRAKAAGIEWRTVERAKQALGVRARKDGMSGAWRWSLPEVRQTEDRQSDTPQKVGGLPADQEVTDENNAFFPEDRQLPDVTVFGRSHRDVEEF